MTQHLCDFTDTGAFENATFLGVGKYPIYEMLSEKVFDSMSNIFFHFDDDYG